MGKKVKYSRNELLLMDKISIIEYYNKYVIPINPNKFRPMSLSRTEGICPLHDETDPSFHSWGKNKVFHCFGCGSGGNVVRLHMLIRRKYYKESLEMKDAIKSLAQLEDVALFEESIQDEIKSIFDRARELVKQDLVIPKDKFSIAEFRQLNNRLVSSNLAENIKVQNFELMDAVACVVFAEVKNNESV